MESRSPMSFTGWSSRIAESRARLTASDILLRIVDIGLCAILCVAPYFFGGRHDLGRLVLVSLVGVTSIAWFARQTRFSVARYPRTVAYLIPLIAGGFLMVQLLPLPPALLAHVAPRIYALLPLWTADSTAAARLGTWCTISFTPHETTKSLAMLVAYGLLFAVVVGRIRDVADINRLLNWLAVGAGMMAVFGIVQYFTSDGRFFWFYVHPARTTTQSITGAFINRNHFAGFLVLGLGPIVAQVVRLWHPARQGPQRGTTSAAQFELAVKWSVAAALAAVVLAILGSRSRGGAIVMLVAGTVQFSIYAWRRLVDTRFLYGLGALGVIVVMLLSFYGFDDVAERLDDFAAGSIDEIDHGAIRRKLWTANLAAFQLSWLTGAGAGSHCEICPVYLPESLTKEYIYAENGYLQIATETGVVGLILLGTAVAFCVAWSVRGCQHARSESQIRALGAAASGLAASAVHSFVDFVWYVPACMAGTIVLAACVLRLSQIVRQRETRFAATGVWLRSRWFELTAASVLLAAWSIQTFVGPSMAAIHWDRYLRAALVEDQQSHDSLSEFVAGNASGASLTHRTGADLMLRELLAVVAWDPAHARAHRRLANRYMAEFERRGLESSNRMDVTQISDAAMSSAFASPQALADWLQRAFGTDIKLLQFALRHARRTVELCPLQGEGYVYLADLCFLNQAPREAIAAYVDQGLLVRPYDRNVLHRAGRQELLSGRNDAAIEFWSRCFNTPGPHQQQIVFRLLYSGMPARMLVDRLKPQWQTLREVWDQYRKSGTPQDLADLLSYAADIAPQEVEDESSAIRPGYVWYRLAAMYADVGRIDEALPCLEHAYACDPVQYSVRYALGKALITVGRVPEAEPHVRWCLARRPGDRYLTDALLAISKHRLVMRTTARAADTIIPMFQPHSQQPPAPAAANVPTIQQ